MPKNKAVMKLQDYINIPMEHLSLICSSSRFFCYSSMFKSIFKLIGSNLDI